MADWLLEFISVLFLLGIAGALIFILAYGGISGIELFLEKIEEVKRS